MLIILERPFKIKARFGDLTGRAETEGVRSTPPLLGEAPLAEPILETKETVSWVFPRLETGFSAYLCGIRPSVSLFPRFRVLSGGVS
jgi:hypothetical protein